MSIYIGQEDAFAKMAEVEGELWERQQQDDPNPNTSFVAFFETWKRDYAENAILMKEGAALDYFVSVEGDGAIYGYLGYNRYGVRADGKIFFLRDLAINQESLERAKEVGFDLF